MQRRGFMKLFGAALLCPICVNTANADGAKHWEYEGVSGAKNWGELDKSFQSCSIGTQQSPVNITGGVEAKLPSLKISYRATIESIVNNGHTIQANMKQGSTLLVENETYNLLQFHFHRPSEHRINGKNYPMEVHFVHKNAAGKLGVVGVLMEEGKPNPAFSKIISAMPVKTNTDVKLGVSDIDFTTLLPEKHSYYRYAGSLTTPPCSEEVNWMLMTNTIEVAASDIAAFAKLFPNNARPVQKIFERFVLKSL